jgi:phosphoserine phosphatase RsbU/P
VTWLKPTAPAIGLSEEFLPRTECVTLEHGDILFLYTDGVTEAFNQVLEQFGSLRLAEVLRKSSAWAQRTSSKRFARDWMSLGMVTRWKMIQPLLR